MDRRVGRANRTRDSYLPVPQPPRRIGSRSARWRLLTIRTCRERYASGWLVVGPSSADLPPLRHDGPPGPAPFGRAARVRATISIMAINTCAFQRPCAVHHRQSRRVLGQKASCAYLGGGGAGNGSAHHTHRMPRIFRNGRRIAPMHSASRVVNHSFPPLLQRPVPFFQDTRLRLR